MLPENINFTVEGTNTDYDDEGNPTEDVLRIYDDNHNNSPRQNVQSHDDYGRKISILFTSK